MEAKSFPPYYGTTTEQLHTDIGTLIVQTPGVCGGRPRIAGHRVTVQNIAIDFNAGMSPEEMMTEKPHLKLAEIYAALAYYFANQNAIDAAILTEDEECDRLETKYWMEYLEV
ncbi:MAG: DUF433 domain-containing protein [Oculatellaceae cyanobacterium Prado106]|jgi:uncharacterized protein (DUF433 family)|nr:DUF433 domain-containing protein [Oculatellaceae cyanobacterium Prado106]